MRFKFVACKYPWSVKRECPWASIFVCVGGGYMAFESDQDYNLWKKSEVVVK